MKFKLVENYIEEEYIVEGVNYEKLIKAAAEKDFDYVLNKYPQGHKVNLPERIWDKVYDLLFDTDKDTLYTPEEHKINCDRIDAYANNYNAV